MPEETDKLMMPLLSFDNVTLRFPEKILLEDFSLQLQSGEHWAVVGPSGTGKTTFLNSIAGKHHIINGTIKYHFFDDFVAHHQVEDPFFTFRHLIAMVSFHHEFRNRSNTKDFFYQQRYQSAYADEAVSVEEYLEKVAAEEQVYSLPEKFTIAWVIDQLHLQALRDRSLIKLSTGETRRLLIAAALLRQPRILLLDNPLLGLDVETRSFFHALLDEISKRDITLIMVTSPEEIPQNFTHVLTLGENEGYNISLKADYKPPEKSKQTSIKIDNTLLNELGSNNVQDYVFETAVQLKNVCIRYGGQLILDHVDWKIQKGEKWALLGPNGAGKTTLLSLLNGDNPQAYANDISLFDKKRGTGESIWDIKRKIGFMSSEMHQYLQANQTCLSVVISGFFDILGVSRKATDEQTQTALDWMRVLSIENLKTIPFKHVSAGKQRLVLLARALVKNPPLLILDEPCQGLDQEQKSQFISIVEQLGQSTEKTMIYVSHYREEIPPCISKTLRLEKGKVV